jgi:hypothetical protein
MSCEQLRKIVTSVGAFVGITGAERGDVAAEISRDDGSAEQPNQIGPRLAELLQQAVDPAARRFGLMDVVGAKLAKKLGKALAVEPPYHAALLCHGVTPAQL